MNIQVCNNLKNTLADSFLKQIESIKILLYKNNQEIFEDIDFENDKIYQEPLLYSYFNDEKKLNTGLDQILIGYEEGEEKNVKVKSDEFGRIYLPNIGWFTTSLINQELNFLKNKKALFINSEKIDFTFEGIEVIENTKIEVLKYQIPLLKQCYFNVDKEQIEIEIEIEIITKKHLKKPYKSISTYKTIYT